MDPASSLIADYVKGKLIGAAETAIRTQVVERWSKYRARQFFDEFCNAILDASQTDEDIGQQLNSLLSDDVTSEVVFDAYRSVCLSKSRALGPRIIALLTAELLLAKKTAGLQEDMIFAAAEELSDEQFSDLSEFVSYQRIKSAKGNDCGVETDNEGAITVKLGEELLDSNWMRGSEHSRGPLNLAHDLGTWAPKLKQLGLISDDVRERQWRYQEDSERHIDQPGVATEITWWVTVHKEAMMLVALIDRASKNLPE